MKNKIAPITLFLICAILYALLGYLQWVEKGNPFLLAGYSFLSGLFIGAIIVLITD